MLTHLINATPKWTAEIEVLFYPYGPSVLERKDCQEIVVLRILRLAHAGSAWSWRRLGRAHTGMRQREWLCDRWKDVNTTLSAQRNEPWTKRPNSWSQGAVTWEASEGKNESWGEPHLINVHPLNGWANGDERCTYYSSKCGNTYN